LLSGISAGIFTGTATVAVIELVELAPPAWRQHATLVATASNMLGLGCGPLLGGILVAVGPWPTRLPYAVHLVLVAAAILAVIGVPETVQLPHRIKLTVQKMSLPASVRETFIPAAMAGFAGFMVIGFFAAVAPELIRTELGFHSTVFIGAIIFLFFLFSTCGQVVQAHLALPWRQPIGCLSLILGLLAMVVCAAEESLGALLIGTIAAGFGQGMSFRAGLNDISAKSPPGQRAEVTSSFFVVLYIAISGPVIGIGFAVQAVGIQRATIVFSCVAAILVAGALLLLIRRRTAAPILDAPSRPECGDGGRL
jgi:MFS family permease